MPDPRQLAPPQSVATSTTPTVGATDIAPSGGRGDAILKGQVRQAFGYDAQACILEPSPNGTRKVPVPGAPVGVFGPEHTDPGREGLAAMRKDMGRGKAPDELAIPRANQRRIEGRGDVDPVSADGKGRGTTGHRGFTETTAFVDGRGGVVVRSGGEVRPESGQGVGAKGAVDLGVGVDGASMKVGGDLIGGKRTGRHVAGRAGPTRADCGSGCLFGGR